jgi:hypothetical protein
VAEVFKFYTLGIGALPSYWELWEAGETSRIVLTGYKLDFTNDVATDTPGPVNVFLDTELGGYQFLATSAYVPETGGHRVGAYSTGWIDVDEVEFGTQGDKLIFYADVELTAGSINVLVRGHEIEVGYPVPEVDTVNPTIVPMGGGATVTFGGSWLRELLGLTVAEVPVTPTTIGDDGEQVVFASPVHAESSGVTDKFPFALTTTGGTLNSIPLFAFYDPALIAHIEEIDPVTMSVAAGMDPVTATGYGFDYFGGVVKVGFFTSDYGDTIPPGPPTGYATATVVNDGELTFTIGGIPPGTYYVIPGISGPWLGTSVAQITITPM